MKKRLYADGQSVYVKKLAYASGIVVGYRKGNPYPYIVRIAGTGRKHYASYKGLSSTRPGVETSSNDNRKESNMSNIRQKIKQLTLSKEARLFAQYEITDDKGNLTDLGRRVVMDKLFEDKDLRAAVLADVEAVDSEKDSKKSKK